MCGRTLTMYLNGLLWKSSDGSRRNRRASHKSWRYSETQRQLGQYHRFFNTLRLQNCLRYSIFDARCSMLDARCSMLDARCSMLDARCSMLDARCSMLDARCSMLDARCSMLDARCSMLDTRYSILYLRYKSSLYKLKLLIICA